MSFFGNLEGKAEIVITNQVGEILLKNSVFITRGSNQYLIDIGNFFSGVYIFKLNKGGKEYVRKLIIQK